MFKTILAHLNGSECDAAVLQTSLVLAQIDGGHLECLRVSPDPAALIAQSPQFDVGMSMAVADTLQTIEKQGRDATRNANGRFLTFCKHEKIAEADTPPGPNGISATWREKTGDELDEIVAQARFNDIVVLAGGTRRPGRLSEESLGHIVVASGRPVLLAPQKPVKTLTGTIAIAWKDSAEAARAVVAAMPLLAKGRHVHVLAANEDDRKAIECLECSDSVVQQLRWHGLKAHGRFVIPAGRPVPDAILETAHSVGADLLVMGGYGHSRVRELLFGGFTQRVLHGADLPVFLFH